jgi:peptidoglycan/xylan/chitin deacetylase (PgdA/CDA1 family)
MPLWKQLLLTLYYQATWPVRTCRYWHEVSRDHLPVMVLFYHRIADDRANPWTISNAMFVRQMRWLQERFDFVSLADAQGRIRRGYNPQPCISITFDDGYADNCQQAIPWLIKERIPCAYFVTLRNVLNAEPFSHDLVMGHRFAPNTLEQLRAMAAAGIEIGAHTYTHADLGRIADPRLLHYEIVTAREDLQTVLNRPIHYLAFPFGHYANLNPTAFEMAKRAGYAGVCSAYGGFNFPGDDPFHLQRIPVDNDMIRLKNWVTMDPRKLRTRRFVYQEAGDRDQGAATSDQRSVAVGGSRQS